MFTMKGKYNFANVMIDEIEESTRNQIQGFLNHPAFGKSYIAIMPDCHAGNGAVIGLTMKVNDYIIPNVIGVDIGCGMLSVKLDIEDPESFDPSVLDEAIRETIPSGFNINQVPLDIGHQSVEISETCERIGIDAKKALRAIGSLGGGNHFIEVGLDGADHWLTIHSGSRNFGLKVANFYQKKAKEGLGRYFIDGYKDLEFMPIDTSDAMDYLHDMAVAQRFADTNRRKMAERICSEMNIIPLDHISSVHNFIGDDMIIRKGATSAKLGERVIIPFNMRDGLAICTGKGNKKYNYSAPHGAGRILSRRRARESVKIEDFEASMEGIYSSCISESTLDESPMAYKDMNLILDNISETVNVDFMVKPIYNFKAT